MYYDLQLFHKKFLNMKVSEILKYFDIIIRVFNNWIHIFKITLEIGIFQYIFENKFIIV
jgi:hypothetical protein